MKSLNLIVAVFSILLAISCNASELQRYIDEEYPLFFDTYKKTESDHLYYAKKSKVKNLKNRNVSEYYYIHGNILLHHYGYLIRESESKYGSRLDFLSSSTSIKKSIEYQNYYKDSFRVYEKYGLKYGDYNYFNKILSQVDSPKFIEKIILEGLERTTKKSLEGCPSIPEDDLYYECSPIANSWSEYLYKNYSKIFDNYSSLLDKDNMQRIEKAFLARISLNKKNEDLEWFKSSSQSYSKKFVARRKEFWRAYNAGELNGEVVDINTIPAAYSSIPLYWKDYVVAKGLEKYSQWDVRGIESPSGFVKNFNGEYIKASKLKKNKLLKVQPNRRQ